MKYKLVLFISIIYSITGLSQKADKYYKEGAKLLANGNFEKADSLFNLAIKLEDNKDYYYNRGVAKLKLMDTIAFCNNMFIAKELGDIGARNLFYSECLKTDSIASSNFYKGLNEFIKSNYVLADSFFLVSFNEIPTYKNIYYDYLTKINLRDSIYAYFMLQKLFAYNAEIDKLIKNGKYIDKNSVTSYYNNSFTKKVETSDNVLVEIKEPNGIRGFYYTKENPLLADYFIKDTIKYFTRSEKVKFNEKKINTYINDNSIFPLEVQKYFNSNDFIHVYIRVYYRLNGDVEMELYNKNGLNYLLINRIKSDKERAFVIESLTDKAKDIISKIPEKPSFYFKGKSVNFCVTYKVRFKSN